MEHLWAPWRNLYVTRPGESEDGPIEELFTRIAQSSDDEANLVLARGRSCFALLNRYPYNAGHLMVVPYTRAADLDALSEQEQLELLQTLIKMKAALTKALRPDGFNIGINLGAAAGAGVAGHLHVHVVPRWEHDSNFMTTTAGTRVHPSDLAAVHRQLKEALG